MIFFIHLPRTGGTFISQYIRHKDTRLKKRLNYYPNLYTQKRHSPASSIPNPQDYYLFGLIRNPYDWYVSRYHYFIEKPSKGVKVGEDDISKYSDAGLTGSDFQRRFKDINEHIKFGLKNNKDNFWLSNLHDYMFYKDGKSLMNHIGKFENMNEELNFVLRQNNLTPRIELKDYWGNKNATVRNKDYREYYTNESIEIIAKKDRKMFELYDYAY